MLRQILILVLVGGVANALKGENDLSDCMKLTHFSTKVGIEDVEGKLMSVYSTRYKDPEQCEEITLTTATKEDIEEIKTRCNGTFPKSFPFRQTVKFDWDQAIKRVSYSHETTNRLTPKMNDTLISKKDDTYKILLDCEVFIYIECRKFRDNLVLFAWNDAGIGRPEFIRLAENEQSRCLVDNQLTEIGYPLLPQYTSKYEFCRSPKEFL